MIALMLAVLQCVGFDETGIPNNRQPNAVGTPHQQRGAAGAGKTTLPVADQVNTAGLLSVRLKNLQSPYDPRVENNAGIGPAAESWRVVE